MSSAWSLSLEEVELVGTKPAVQRLGFAIQLKMYCLHGRFFETVREVPVETIGVIASMLGRPITDVLSYDWEGRSRLAGSDAAHLSARKSVWPVRTRPGAARRLRQEVGSMSYLIAPMLLGDRQLGSFSGQEVSLCGALKIAPNKRYWKYTERYQYVTLFCAKSHAEAAACSLTCETLLRNQPVMQQGCAC